MRRKAKKIKCPSCGAKGLFFELSKTTIKRLKEEIYDDIARRLKRAGFSYSDWKISSINVQILVRGIGFGKIKTVYDEE